MMQALDAMTAAVCSVDQVVTLQQATGLMTWLGTGALPVLRGRPVVGMVSDGGIERRGHTLGLDAHAPVARVMTRGVHVCHAGEYVEDVLLEMQFLELRRMPVEDDHGQLVGVVNFSALAATCSERSPGQSQREILASQVEPMPGALR